MQARFSDDSVTLLPWRWRTNRVIEVMRSIYFSHCSLFSGAEAHRRVNHRVRDPLINDGHSVFFGDDPVLVATYTTDLVLKVDADGYRETLTWTTGPNSVRYTATRKLWKKL